MGQLVERLQPVGRNKKGKIMADHKINYVVRNPLELNLLYMPFITGGGLFIPSKDKFVLGDRVVVDMQLPGRVELLSIEGKVVWITPTNALHHVLPGIGIQFIGAQAATTKNEIETRLDKKMDIGGYTCGITDEEKRGT